MADAMQPFRGLDLLRWGGRLHFGRTPNARALCVAAEVSAAADRASAKARRLRSLADAQKNSKEKRDRLQSALDLEILVYAATAPKAVLRYVVDLTWQYARQDESVPSTWIADALIDRALQGRPGR